jgi:isopenicillin N synthase-like dioxygenase
MEKDTGSPTYAVLDFLALKQADRQQLAQILVENLSKNGFLYLLNHGILEETVRKLIDFSENRRFYVVLFRRFRFSTQVFLIF